MNPPFLRLVSADDDDDGAPPEIQPLRGRTDGVVVELTLSHATVRRDGQPAVVLPLPAGRWTASEAGQLLAAFMRPPVVDWQILGSLRGELAQRVKDGEDEAVIALLTDSLLACEAVNTACSVLRAGSNTDRRKKDARKVDQDIARYIKRYLST